AHRYTDPCPNPPSSPSTRTSQSTQSVGTSRSTRSVLSRLFEGTHHPSGTAAEAADVADDLRAERRPHVGLDRLDRRLAGTDGDAGGLVGLTHCRGSPGSPRAGPPPAPR